MLCDLIRCWPQLFHSHIMQKYCLDPRDKWLNGRWLGLELKWLTESSFFFFFFFHTRFVLWAQVQIKAGGKYCLELSQLPPKSLWDYTKFYILAHQPFGNKARSLQSCKILQSWIRFCIPVLKAKKKLNKLSQQANPDYTFRAGF